jgi:hypothetical protein
VVSFFNHNNLLKLKLKNPPFVILEFFGADAQKNIRDPGGKVMCHLNLLRFKNIYSFFSWIPGCALHPQDDKKKNFYPTLLTQNFSLTKNNKKRKKIINYHKAD